MRDFLWAVCFCVLLMACQPSDHYYDGRYEVWLESRSDTLYVLNLAVDGRVSDTLQLPYPVYQFDCGDLTGDGCPEVCVGVIKPTRFWPRGKRLFIYQLYHGRYIRPLWMGSRLGNLESFYVERDSVPARIVTNEAVYHLGGFGLIFEHYLP